MYRRPEVCPQQRDERRVPTCRRQLGSRAAARVDRAGVRARTWLKTPVFDWEAPVFDCVFDWKAHVFDWRVPVL